MIEKWLKEIEGCQTWFKLLNKKLREFRDISSVHMFFFSGTSFTEISARYMCRDG